MDRYPIGISVGYLGTKLVTSDIVHCVTVLMWRHCSVCEHLPCVEQTARSYSISPVCFCIFQVSLALIQTLSSDFTVKTAKRREWIEREANLFSCFETS